MSESQRVTLRPVEWVDIDRMFTFQNDDDACATAAVYRKSHDVFCEHWRKILSNPLNTARVIVWDRRVIGQINCFPYQGHFSIGYWISRSYWGKGMATEAVGIFLREIAERPLIATVAEHNPASLRVLEKNGFVEERRYECSADANYPAAKLIELWLRS